MGNRQSQLLHAHPRNSLEETKASVVAIEESPSGSRPRGFERGAGVISHLWEGCDGIYACLGRGAVTSVTIARDHPLDTSAAQAYGDARHDIVPAKRIDGR